MTTVGKLSLDYGEYEGEIKDGLASGKGTVVYANGDNNVGAFLFGQESSVTHMEDGKANVGEVTYPILTEVPKVPHDAGHRVPEPNDGYYHVRTDRPAGIVIYAITLHEGFRPPGLKAVDVHIIARSKVNGENQLVQGRDEIISITGSTGKVYDMTGTKRTGVNTSAIPTATSTYEEQELTEYQDVSVNEKTITSIVVRRDGKNITITPDKDTKVETTHAQIMKGSFYMKKKFVITGVLAAVVLVSTGVTIAGAYDKPVVPVVKEVIKEVATTPTVKEPTVAPVVVEAPVTKTEAVAEAPTPAPTPKVTSTPKAVVETKPVVKTATSVTKVPVAVPVTTPVATIGKLVIYKGDNPDQPGDYVGSIIAGKAEGQGEVHWRNPEKFITNASWKGNFWHNYPMGEGTHTYTTIEDGVVHTFYTLVEGLG